MQSRLSLWTTIAVSLAVLIGIGLLLLPRDPQPVPMPNPNGWDDFMAAAQKLSNKTPDFDKSSAELQDYVSASQDALKLAREGLQKQTRVPALVADTNGALRVDELSQFKRLAMAFNAEGRFAQLEGRPDDAAKGYLETIQLGQQCAHGGLLIHYLVAVACENIGLTGLEGITADLNAQQCRASSSSLEKLETSREPFEQVMAAEEHYNYSRGVVIGIITRISNRQSYQKADTKVQKLSTRTQTLQVTLAARAYKLEKGKAPQSYSDLVPEYLTSIPVNPITKQQLDFTPVQQSLQSK